MTHGAGRSAGGGRADLRARLVSQVEGTLAGRRGLLREEGCASWATTLRRVRPAGPRGVLAGLESAACERPAGGVQWKGRSDASGHGEKRAVAGRAGDGASWPRCWVGGRERRGKWPGPVWAEVEFGLAQERGRGLGCSRVWGWVGSWAGLRWFGPLSWMAYGFRLSCRFGFSNLFPFFFFKPHNLFEFKFKFEFNPNTQSNKTMHQHECTSMLNLDKFLITCGTK